MNSMVNTKHQYIAPSAKILELPQINILAGSNQRIYDVEVDPDQRPDDFPEENWGGQI